MDVELKKGHDRKYSAKYYQEHREEKLAYFRKYRQTKLGSLNQRKANDRYKAKNPDRVRAWSKVAYYRLKKEPCEVCRSVTSYAHHPDPKKVLEVVWLCPLHHKRAHLNVILYVGDLSGADKGRVGST